MKKIVLLLFCTIAMLQVKAQAQNGRYNSFADRLFAGGSFGLNFGSRITQIDLLPLGGIWILPQWNVGVSGRYSFRNERFNLEQGTSTPKKNHIWGVSGFTQVLPIPDLSEAFNVNIHGGLLFQCEYECLYVNKRLVNMNDASSGKTWTNICFVGVGWRQLVGVRSAVNLVVLWDVSQNTYTPYIDNPVLRFSVTF